MVDEQLIQTSTSAVLVKVLLNSMQSISVCFSSLHPSTHPFVVLFNDTCKFSSAIEHLLKDYCNEMEDGTMC